MAWSGGIGSNEWQVDFALHYRRQLHFGFLGGFTHTLQRGPIAAHVDAGVFFEDIDEVMDDSFVEVIATEVGVAVGG